MLPDVLYLGDKKYVAESTNAVQLYRVPHDVERYNVDKDDMRYAGARVGVVRKTIRESGTSRPEIFRVNPDHTTPIGEGHQWLWKNINPELSNTRWGTLLGNYLAWTNQSGFPGRRNYVNNQDMDKGLPNFDAPRVNGGQILEGDESYSVMQALRLGFTGIKETLMRRNSFLNLRKSFKATITENNIVWIKCLLTSDPIPNVHNFLNSHMWAWGISISPTGNIYYINRVGIDGTNKRVRIPLLMKQRIWLPKNELHKLPLGSIPPEPTWVAGS